MNTRKTGVQSRKIETSHGTVQELTPPYLDWRIDPYHLDFNREDPGHSPVNQALGSINIGNKTYVLCSVIGQGGFGKVYLAQDITTNEFIALKEPIGTPNEKEFNEEIEQLKKSGNLVFADEKNSIIGMKLLEGHELYKTMVTTEGVTDNLTPQDISLLQKIVIAKGAIKNLAGLHHDVRHMKGERDEKIVVFHRDIKTNNINVNFDDLTVKYCDYGMAKSFKGKPATKPTYKSLSSLQDEKAAIGEFVTDTLQGTEASIAPELYDAMMQNKPIKHNQQTEVFALGVTLAQIFGLAQLDENEYYNNDRYRYKLVSPPGFPQALFELVNKMMHKDPEKRPTVVRAYQELNAIQHTLGETLPMTVCVLSIDDFLKYNDEQKSDFINKVIDEKINAVVLQGSENTSLEDYYQVKYQLKQNKIVSVSPFMAKTDNELDEEAIYRIAKDHYDQKLDTFNTRVFAYNTYTNRFIENTAIAKQIEVFPPPKGVLPEVSPLPKDVLPAKPKKPYFSSASSIFASLKAKTSTALSSLKGKVKALRRKKTKKAKNVTENQPPEMLKVNFSNKNENEEISQLSKQVSKQGSMPPSQFDHPSANEEPDHIYLYKAGMFNHEKDFNKAVNFLSAHVEFFIDYFKDRSFPEWMENGQKNPELKTFLQNLENIFKKHSIQIPLLTALNGKNDEDTNCLVMGDETLIRKLLNNNKDFLYEIQKHTDDKKIDAAMNDWYTFKDEKENANRFE